jgi:hypothetical protein
VINQRLPVAIPLLVYRAIAPGAGFPQEKPHIAELACTP